MHTHTVCEDNNNKNINILVKYNCTIYISKFLSTM